MKKRDLHKDKLKNRLQNGVKNSRFFDGFLKQEVLNELGQNLDEGPDIFSEFQIPDFQFEDFDLNFDFTFDIETDFSIDMIWDKDLS